MAALAKKQVTDAEKQRSVHDDTPSSAEIVGDAAGALGSGAGTSPARMLQDRLHAHFSPVASKMSVQFITLVIMFTCVGTWIAGMGLSTGSVAI